MGKVVFDICGTMYKSNTTFDFLDFFFSGNKGYLKARRLSRLFFVRAVNKIIILLTGKDILRCYFVSYLKGVSRHRLQEQSNLFYRQCLSGREIDFTISKLNEINACCDIILASATLDCIAKVIADKYNVSYISSELEFINDICTGRMSVDLLGKKHQYFKGKIDLVVTDNKSDFKLIQLAEKSIVISNSRNKLFWVKKRMKNMSIFEVE